MAVDRDSPYLTLRPRRAAASGVAGFLAVAAVALVTKTVVETLTRVVYTIHWLETVPLLTLLFAFVIHGEWNRRVPVPGPEA